MTPTQFDTNRWFFGPNIQKGMRAGVFIATFFAGIATVVRLVSGANSFRHVGISWLHLIAFYFAALLVGGAAYGAVVPLRQNFFGSIVMGFVLVFPLYSALAVVLGLGLQRIPSVGVGLAIGAVLSLLIGGALGVSMWNDDHPPDGG